MHGLRRQRCVLRCALAILATSALCVAAVGDPAGDAIPELLWDEAAAYELRGQYLDAADAYAAILAAYPQSQRAAVMRGVNEVLAGLPADCLRDIDAALAMDPFSRDWAERGYLYKAKAHQLLGQRTDAEQAIAILQSRFPGSILAAEATLIEADLAGANTLAANDAYELELDAQQIYDEAVDAILHDQHQMAINLFDRAISSFPTTHVALRAMEDKARLLEAIPGRSAEAILAYEDILTVVTPSWPQSRLRYFAELQLAGLESSADRKAEALARLTSLADSASDEGVVASAAEQAAQIELRILQIERIDNGYVSSGSWSDVRTMCARVTASARPSVDQLARTGLWLVESLCWEGMSQEALVAGRAYLAVFDTDDHRQETASVRFLMGEELLRLGRYEAALDMFDAIIAEYTGEQDIWPGMDHMPRVYFRIWETLRRMGAPPGQIEEAANELLNTFPESSYAEHIRIVTQQEEE